jgi:hypothetical protein
MLKRLPVTCFGKLMFVVPVDCGGHAVLGWVWFFVVVCSLLSLVVLFSLYETL